MSNSRQPDIATHVAITGASSGLGAALAQLYAQSGAAVSLAGRNGDRLEAAATACRAQSKGAPVETRTIDVTDATAMTDWLQSLDARRPITTLYANAGLGGRLAMAGPAGDDAPAAAALMATNVMGVLNTVIPVVPAMLRRGAGRIVLVSSLAGYVGLPQSPVYAASKAAVRIYGDGLRRRLRGSGVAVTVVSPGFVDTPMSRSLPLAPPGVWPVERAARHIADGVARGRAEIAFPQHLAAALRIGALLPRSLTDALIRFGERLARSEQ